ncbi:MAG TPA: isoprenylcysteine carboxylmethyltransferase family protein [Spirochaetota bacterium]|nr:isoprenylcysteine carboxylmethyltransferase family protein [Spirochaetota bacterium]HPS86936.1 isoprenylcysteine carboxylmethyltransferase family protein [Spirochaetota bacterium]
MNRKELLQYIAGYFFGGSFFLLVIPGVLYSVSVFFSSVFPHHIFENDRIKVIVSSAFFFPGIFFVGWSNAALFLIGKGGPAEGFGIEISPKTKVLVTKGPYRYTRNPMVFGAYMVYIALSFFLNSFASLILIILLFPVINIYLKKSEEKRLLKDFGDEFLEYRESVSRFIPLPPKK